MNDQVNDIKEAESHILNGDNNAFWNPKLAQLREDKQYLNTTEMQLRLSNGNITL